MSALELYQIEVCVDLFSAAFAPLPHMRSLTKEVLDAYGMPLEQALALVRHALPPSAVLVGYNIGNDVDWLGLREGEDFKSMIDLAGVTRIWNPQYKNYTVYGQDHIARHLLNWDTSASHDAVG